MLHARRRSCAAFALLAALLLLVLPTDAAADGETISLGDALSLGTFSLNLRYRFESVEQADRFGSKGNASTLRTTLAYHTTAWHGLSAFVEVEDVHDLGLEDSHNNAGAGSLGNGVITRPVVADPQITEINQAYLALSCPRGVSLRAGRQEVILGNHRFVGNVGWRQNHQSFDAARVDVTALEDTSITFVYVDRVHRIFGDSKPMSSHLLEAVRTFEGVGTLRGHAYLLDYDKQTDWRLSTMTYGASFDGSVPLSGKNTLLYRAELAEQQDAGDNPGSIDAGYRRADLGLRRGKLTVKLGYELLEGGDEGAFATPLATLHAFNGWADLFLSTPPDGLEDLSVSVEAALSATKLAVIWHRFGAESTSRDLGSELDVLALFSLPWKQKIGVKAALYDADAHAVDTNKLMIWTSWGF